MNKSDNTTRPQQMANLKGIPEHKEKLSGLQHYFQAYSLEELAIALVCGSASRRALSPGEENDVATLVRNIKSYNATRSIPSDPTGSAGRKYLKYLEERLNTELSQYSYEVNMTAYLKEPYATFYDSLPSEMQERFPTPVMRASQNTRALKIDEGHYSMWRRKGTKLETVKDGFHRGRIDHKFYYMTPESANHWEDVVNADEYPQYGYCKAALGKLTSLPLWQNFVVQNAGGVVILGAGAPTKDLLIINSALDILSAGRSLNYALVDFSPFMLDNAFQFVDKALTATGRRGFVKLIPVNRDFLDLAGTSELLRPDGKNVAWFIPGGTIGNLNEGDFFKSIQMEAQDGDILVIGAEFVETADRENNKPLLVSKYKNQSVRNFVMAPLQAAWHELEFRESLERTFDKIQVDVVSGQANSHSSIKGAATVELSIGAKPCGRLRHKFLQMLLRHKFLQMLERVLGRPSAHDKIILLTSTRYLENEFIAFADGYGFRHDLTVESPRNNSYKQLVFRFEKERGALSGGRLTTE